jgi:hypothetical protein
MSRLPLLRNLVPLHHSLMSLLCSLISLLERRLMEEKVKCVRLLLM